MASGADPTCTCGFDQTSPEVPRLSHISARCHEITLVLRDLDAEMRALLNERTTLLDDVFARGRVRDWVAPAPEVVESPEWSSAKIRTALLWLGSTLVVSGAVGFCGYEWTRLGPGGRSLILAALTGALLTVSVAIRRRLPSTAEALAATGLVMALVEWGLLHSVAGTGTSNAGWWVPGLLVTLSVGVGLGRLGLRAGSAVGGASGVTVVPLALSCVGRLGFGFSATAASDSLWPVVLVADLLVARALWNRPAARVAGRVMAVLASGLGLVVVVSVPSGAINVVSGSPSGAVAGVLVALQLAGVAAAALVARHLWREELGTRASDLIVGLAAASTICAFALGFSGVVPELWLPAIGVGAAGGCRVAARRAGASFERGTAVAAAVIAGTGAVATTTTVLAVLFAPMLSSGAIWSGRLSAIAANHLGGQSSVSLTQVILPFGVTLVTWAAVAGVVAVGTSWVVSPDTSTPWRLPRAVGGALLSLFGAAAIATVPLAMQSTIGVTVAILDGAVFLAGGVSIWIGRARPTAVFAQRVLLTLAALVAVPALGWSGVRPLTTLVSLGLVGAVAVGLAVVAPARTVTREAAAAVSLVTWLVFTGLAASAAHMTLRADVLVVTAVAVGAIVALQLGARDRVLVGAEGVAFVSLPVLAAIELAQSSARYTALALTISMLGFAVASATARAVVGHDAPASARSRGYRHAAAICALPVTWAWLGASHVHLVEAYTWSSAVLIVTASLLLSNGRSAGDRTTSWLTWGPGLVVGLVPSIALTVDLGGVVRPVCLAALSISLIGLGAARRLRAPIILAGATLVVLGVNAAAPYLGDGPRWVTVGVAGVLLLGAGATLERRASGARSLWRRYRQLG